MIKFDDILELSFASDVGAVVMAWKGFSGTEHFQAANEHVLDFIKEKRARKMIADLRDMRILSLSNQQWLYQNWFPRLINAGVSYIAIVESDDYFNRLTVDNVVQKIDDKLTIKYFNAFLSARYWLKSL